MAITPNDFSKIWASNADTPEYTFSDADYLKGWDFVGNLPPTRAMWNAMQKSTDEKMKYVFDNFGAPLTASTVADMTMQNRVYVYTGSETGYTAGHWYYWNGSAWTDGGVYNSNTVQVDPTLTISGAAADAKVTGDIVYDLQDNIKDIAPCDRNVPVTFINKLNFVENGTNFTASNAHKVYCVSVRNGFRYVFNATSVASSGYIRFVFSNLLPADNTAGTYLGKLRGQGSGVTLSYEFVAQSNGYLSIAVYATDLDTENVECRNVQIGILPRIEQDEEKIEEIQDDIKDVAPSDRSVSATFAGNYLAESGTDVFVERSTYSIYCVSAKKGYRYVFTATSLADNILYRFVFSAQFPAAGVGYNYLAGVYAALAGDTVQYAFVAPSDGYFCVCAYYTAINEESFEFRNVQLGVMPIVESLQSSVASITKNVYGQGRLLLYLEPEALVQDGNSVKMNQWTEVPYYKARAQINCPTNIIIRFELKQDAYTNVTTTTQYYGDGDTAELPAEYELYKIQLCYGEKSADIWTPTDSSLTVADVTQMVLSKLITITYIDKDIVTNNTDIEKTVRALIGDKPCISHISDTHGDAIRYSNFMSMSEHMGVMCAVNSGDCVAVNPSDGCQYLKTAIREYPHVQTIFCMGNHDHVASNENAYTRYYKMYDDAYDYSLSADKTYYYKDYATEKLRFIVLNIYEERCISYACMISETQINWFINVLASTPADYGVFVVAHSSEKEIKKNASYGMFFSKEIIIDWACRYANITGDPVSKIIDAFISKSTVSGSYIQTVRQSVGSSTYVDETVNYSADFTNVPASAEFIAYINGHKHKDMVGYFEGTNNLQLSLNITHGVTGTYYKNQDDFPRGDGRGATQDAFNLYAIDRTNKAVTVIRVGSNKLFDLTDRDYMTIPYA